MEGWGGHCCEANISAMCLIRLCGIKKLHSRHWNQRRQTDRDTSGLVAGTVPVFAHTISAQTKHVEPFAASLLLYFLFSPPLNFKSGSFTYLVCTPARTKPTTGRAGAKQRPAFFLGDDKNKNVETAERERKSSGLVERGRGEGVGLYPLSMNKILGLMVNPGHTFTCTLPL